MHWSCEGESKREKENERDKRIKALEAKKKVLNSDLRLARRAKRKRRSPRRCSTIFSKATSPEKKLFLNTEKMYALLFKEGGFPRIRNELCKPYDD